MWTLLLIAAVLWPGRLAGPLDGVPFDAPYEALLLAAALPVLWFLAPGFLRTRTARGLVAGLLAWKLAAWLILAQTGLCATFLAAPQPDAAMQMEPSWDARTLWTPQGGCSAVFTHGYESLEEFPAWTLNILPDAARPPAGAFGLRVRGIVVTHADAPLMILGSAGARPSGDIDGHAVGPADWPVLLAAGAHRVDVSVTLRGSRWRFVPMLGNGSLISHANMFVTPPSALDRALGGWAQWLTPGLVLALLLSWAAFTYRALQPSALMLGWTALASLAAFALGATVEPPAVRFAMLGLLPAAALAVPERSRTLRSAFLLVGLPWLAFFAGRSLHDIGRFTIYTAGDDWWTFQRHAYRIFMEGFWFEGGEKTFWNQPLYRWTAGLLHVVFGDSSAGEMYLDAAGLAIGAMFAFDSVRRLATFRAGLVAAILVLNIAMLGPNWYGIGRGLSEISAALWLYLAAFVLWQSEARTPRVLLAGLLAALAFFTRLNHLVLLVAMTALLVPSSVEAGDVWHPSKIWRRVPVRSCAIYLSCLLLAVLALSTRTWFYTGHFSPFLGTQRDLVSTGLGVTTLLSRAAWSRGIESVAMIVTVHDPPRLDPRVVVVTIGALLAVGALAAAPIVRRLPFWMAAFCVGAFVSGLFVRGSAYSGRFSVQLIPIATAVTVSVLASVLRPRGWAAEVHHE